MAGAPLVVLANRHAFLFNLGMCSWLRVADDTFPASNFVSTWPDSAASAENGELALLQAGVARAAGPSFLWNRSVCLSVLQGYDLVLKHDLHFFLVSLYLEEIRLSLSIIFSPSATN